MSWARTVLDRQSKTSVAINSFITQFLYWGRPTPWMPDRDIVNTPECPWPLRLRLGFDRLIRILPERQMWVWTGRSRWGPLPPERQTPNVLARARRWLCCRVGSPAWGCAASYPQCCLTHFPPSALHVAMRRMCELAHTRRCAATGMGSTWGRDRGAIKWWGLIGSFSSPLAP